MDDVIFNLQMSLQNSTALQRANAIANYMGLLAGWSIDFTTQDHDGRTWDLNGAEVGKRAIKRVLATKPLLLIGNPTCTMYNSMNAINHARMSRGEIKVRFDYARKHVESSAKLYKIQIGYI